MSNWVYCLCVSFKSGSLVVLFWSVFTYCLLGLLKIKRWIFSLSLWVPLIFDTYILLTFIKCGQVWNLVTSFSVDPFINNYWFFISNNIFTLKSTLSILFRGSLSTYFWLYLPHLSFYILLFPTIMCPYVSDISLLTVYC